MHRFRIERALAFAGKFQDCIDQGVHFLGRGSNEGYCLGKIRIDNGLDRGSRGKSLNCRIGHERRESTSSDVCSSLVKPITLTERRAKIVADDVGEPLNFLIGALEVRGSLLYPYLQPGIQRLDLRRAAISSRV